MQTLKPAGSGKMGRFFRQLSEYRVLLLMLAPGSRVFIVFCYVPMFGMLIAFKNYDYSLGILRSPWVGFSNFTFLFRSGKLVSLFANTVLYNLAFILVGLVFQLFISVILSELSGRVFKKFCQTAVFLPYFVSIVVVGAIVYNLLNYRYGFINAILTAFGVEKVNFYANAGLVAFHPDRRQHLEEHGLRLRGVSGRHHRH